MPSAVRKVTSSSYLNDMVAKSSEVYAALRKVPITSEELTEIVDEIRTGEGASFLVQSYTDSLGQPDKTKAVWMRVLRGEQVYMVYCRKTRRVVDFLPPHPFLVRRSNPSQDRREESSTP